MSGTEARLREGAAGRGLTLVRGKGRVAGKDDYGKFGLQDARTGHKVFGFGNRGVTASLQEIARFLHGNEDAMWKESLKAGKKRTRPLRRWWEGPA